MANIDVIPHYKSSDGQLHLNVEDAVRAERVHQVTALLVVRRADIGIPFAHLERLAEVIVQTQAEVDKIFKQDIRPGRFPTASQLGERPMTSLLSERRPIEAVAT